MLTTEVRVFFPSLAWVGSWPGLLWSGVHMSEISYWLLCCYLSPLNPLWARCGLSQLRCIHYHHYWCYHLSRAGNWRSGWGGWRGAHRHTSQGKAQVSRIHFLCCVCVNNSNWQCNSLFHVWHAVLHNVIHSTDSSCTAWVWWKYTVVEQDIYTAIILSA